LLLTYSQGLQNTLVTLSRFSLPFAPNLVLERCSSAHRYRCAFKYADRWWKMYASRLYICRQAHFFTAIWQSISTGDWSDLVRSSPAHMCGHACPSAEAKIKTSIEVQIVLEDHIWSIIHINHQIHNKRAH
jgi:hypothetical protein